MASREPNNFGMIHLSQEGWWVTMVVHNSLNHSEVHLIFQQLAMSGDLGNHIVSPVTSLSFSAFKLTIKSWCCKRMRKNHIIFQRSSKEQKKFYQLIICTQRLGPLTLFISGHANFVNLMALGTIRGFCGRSHLQALSVLCQGTLPL